MKTFMRKHLWIGYLFAAVCLYYAFRGISFNQFFQTLLQAKPEWVLLAIGIYVIEFYLRSERWSILIRPVQRIGARALFWPMIIGFFANNVLPLRMGEVVRAHVCGKKFNISRSAALGSIFLERIGDTLAFLATFLAASFFYPCPRYVQKGAWLLGGSCFMAIAVLFLIRRHEDRFHTILDKSPLPFSWKDPIKQMTTHFIHSTSGIVQPRYVTEAMALSIVVWILEGTFLHLMAHAFSLKMDYGQAFFLLFALGLSVTLPQAPGYVGTYEFFGVTALSYLGIPKNQGLAVILAIHGTQFIFIALLGSYGLWREGLSFRHMLSTQEDKV